MGVQPYSSWKCSSATPGGQSWTPPPYAAPISRPARGQIGRGNIGIHSRNDQCFLCVQCRKTFAVTKGTAFYRLRTPAETVVLVRTLLAHGCPLQAIVVAFGFDERTVAAWWTRSGRHGQTVQECLVEQPPDAGHVQADEIRVKKQGGIVWMALAGTAGPRRGAATDTGANMSFALPVHVTPLPWPCPARCPVDSAGAGTAAPHLFDLRPVVYAIAVKLHLLALHFAQARQPGEEMNYWMLLSAAPEFLRNADIAPAGDPPRLGSGNFSPGQISSIILCRSFWVDRCPKVPSQIWCRQ